MRKASLTKSLMALLLALVFGTPMILQALHHVRDAHSHRDHKELTSGAVINKKETKCAICDFKFYLFTADVVLIAATALQQLHNCTNDFIAERHFTNDNRMKMGRAPPILFYAQESTKKI